MHMAVSPEITHATLDGRAVTAYRAAGEGLPVVFSNDYAESGGAVLSRCSQLGCAPFDLVTISGFSWDQCLSPWPSEPVATKDDHFAGDAPAYLEWLLGSVVPWASDTLGETAAGSYVSGYSMAGLFALWSLYETDAFAGAVCASGSLWYPGFGDFATTHDLVASPQGVYLSLGDRESSVRNPALRVTESVFRLVRDSYERRGIPVTFELNPGNHFRDMDLRVAKGITWLLGTAAEGRR
jgi:predicted alpha/beta superfamily hydrolase